LGDSEHEGISLQSLIRNGRLLMFHRRYDSCRLILAGTLLLGLVFASPGHAELPLARLSAAFPPGARQGTTVQVTLTGQDLDQLTSLHFSDARITAKAGAANNVFSVSVPADVPAGTYDVRAVGRYGMSNPRAFVVGAFEETVAQGANTTPQAATPLGLGTTASAVAAPSAAHFYRLSLRKAEHVALILRTRSIDSRMDPSMVLTDSSGRECAVSRRSDPIDFTAPAEGDYLLNVHDVTYRGGPEFFYRLTACSALPDRRDGDGSFDYIPSTAAFLNATEAHLSNDSVAVTPVRVSVSAVASDRSAAKVESVAAQRVEIPCEVTGRFRPRGGVTRYTFDAAAGAALSMEVFSHRLGYPTSAFLLIQRVTLDERGKEKLTDVQEVYESPVNVGGAEFNTASHDPVWRLDVKEASRYRITLRNLFTTGAENGPLPYRLAIRAAAPDFRLIAFPAQPIAEKDSKDIPLWSLHLRRGGVTPIKVVAQRRDGFAGEIQLNVQGLPPGVTCPPTTIAPSATSARLLLCASTSASPTIAPLTLSGTAINDGMTITRFAVPGTVATSNYDAGPKIIEVSSRRARELPVAVSTDAAPLSIVPVESFVETCAFNKVALSFRMIHRGAFRAPIALKLTGHSLLAGFKEVDVDPAADTAAVELDLAQVKLPPGEYDLHVQTLAKFKYAADAHAARDFTASFYSSPIHLVITPAPITLAPTPDISVAAGGKIEMPVAIGRLYHFVDPVDVALIAPSVKGLSGKVTIAKDQSQAKLVVTADGGTPAGRHAVKLQATLKLNGQNVVVEQPLYVTVSAKAATK
jgi:hypothetical protein